VAQVWPVIASRGRPSELCEQLKRLTAQLHEGECVVLVADADAPTAKVGAQFAPKVRVVPLAQRVGVDDARKVGNAFVPSDAVVCEIDDHDWVEPELLQEVRAAFGEDSVFLAYCDVWHTDPNHTIRKLREKPTRGRFCDTGNVFGWGMRAYRKWVYDAVGGYPTEHFPANDYELMCRIEQFGGEECKRHIRRPLVTVIQDSNGVSAQHKAMQEQMVIAIANIALNGGFALPFALSNRMPRMIHKARPVAPTQPPVDSGDRVRARKRSIPRLVHFVWVGPDMPDWARANVEMFKRLNPDFRFLLHGKEILIEQFRAGYEAIEGKHEWARKSDLLRLSALLKLGGWYFDCDFLPLRPLRDIYDDHDAFPEGCFLTQGTPTLVANGIIGAAVNAEFMGVLREEVGRLAAPGKSLSWGAYGPQLYTALARKHAAAIRIGQQEMFYPFQDRAVSREVYAQLRDEGFNATAIERSFRDFPVMPYMMHMSMQDELELPADIAGAVSHA